MKKQGFIFIELMIVVMIVTVLAAVSIPAYTDYLLRSKVSEGFLLSLPVRIAVSDFYAQQGRLPVDNQEAGVLPAPQLQGQYVSQIIIKNGDIAVQFHQEIHGILLLKPQTKQSYPYGSIFWQCMSDATSPINDAYLPSSCKGKS